jgi:hypothetical protein
VFYFRDYTGSIVEYSAEEEIILNDATYVPRVWPTADARAADEWNLSQCAGRPATSSRCKSDTMKE